MRWEDIACEKGLREKREREEGELERERDYDKGRKGERDGNINCMRKGGKKKERAYYQGRQG